MLSGKDSPFSLKRPYASYDELATLPTSTADLESRVRILQPLPPPAAVLVGAALANDHHRASAGAASGFAPLGPTATTLPLPSTPATGAAAAAADTAVSLPPVSVVGLLRRQREERPGYARALRYHYLWTAVVHAGGLLVLLLAAAIAYLERWSVSDGVYFLVVTVTTVGFGDVTPNRPLSRILTCALIACALALVAAVLARMQHEFLRKQHTPHYTDACSIGSQSGRDREGGGARAGNARHGGISPRGSRTGLPFSSPPPPPSPPLPPPPTPPPPPGLKGAVARFVQRCRRCCLGGGSKLCCATPARRLATSGGGVVLVAVGAAAFFAHRPCHGRGGSETGPDYDDTSGGAAVPSSSSSSSSSPCPPRLTGVDALYFSVAALSTVGYGDVAVDTQADPAARAVVLALVCLGPLLLGRAITSFVEMYAESLERLDDASAAAAASARAAMRHVDESFNHLLLGDDDGGGSPCGGSPSGSPVLARPGAAWGGGRNEETGTESHHEDLAPRRRRHGSEKGKATTPLPIGGGGGGCGDSARNALPASPPLPTPRASQPPRAARSRAEAMDLRQQQRRFVCGAEGDEGHGKREGRENQRHICQENGGGTVGGSEVHARAQGAGWEEGEEAAVPAAFALGYLLSVGAIDAAGLARAATAWMEQPVMPLASDGNGGGEGGDSEGGALRGAYDARGLTQRRAAVIALAIEALKKHGHGAVSPLLVGNTVT